MIQSTPMQKYGYKGIDAAKTAKIIPFETFPEVAARIKKAAGGSRSRMPFFFQFSKNGRKRIDKAKQYLKPNNSVLNRICDRFMKTPKLNLMCAGVPPFNWQMLMDHDIDNYDIRAIRIFVEMDTGIDINALSAERGCIGEKVEVLDYDIIADNILHELQENNISLEDAYPSIVKYLFTGRNAEKVSHKQMFWRVFGGHACEVLARNLKTCTICPNCNMKVPAWVTDHMCKGQMKGFVKCIDCGKVVQRRNSRQQRCPECEAENRRIYLNQRHNAHNKAKRSKRKESA